MLQVLVNAEEIDKEQWFLGASNTRPSVQQHRVWAVRHSTKISQKP